MNMTTPSLSELRRLREAAPVLDENIERFVSNACCGCRACRDSSAFIAYAANHALPLLEAETALSDRLAEALRKTNDTCGDYGCKNCDEKNAVLADFQRARGEK